MDKKNTMLLTVIAVATLLVAVVGATFAYFSVTGTQSATTNVKANTGKIGAVNVTQGSNDLNLQVTAQDMAPQDIDKQYYAISGNTGNDGATTGGKWATTSDGLTVATIALSGANEGDTVKCNVNVLVSLTGSMVKELKQGDAFLSLTGIDGLDGVEQIDLSTLKTMENDTQANRTYSSTKDSFSLTGSGSSATKELKAKVWLVNKKKESSSDTGLQNYLADKELTVAITTSVSDCGTTSAAGAGA